MGLFDRQRKWKIILVIAFIASILLNPTITFKVIYLVVLQCFVAQLVKKPFNYKIPAVLYGLVALSSIGIIIWTAFDILGTPGESENMYFYFFDTEGEKISGNVFFDEEPLGPITSNFIILERKLFDDGKTHNLVLELPGNYYCEWPITKSDLTENLFYYEC